MDKLSLLGWPGSPTIGDALALLLPPSTHSNAADDEAGPAVGSVEALLAWLMRRVPSEPSDQRDDEAKEAERSTYMLLASAVTRLGILGLDMEELRRGNGPVRRTSPGHLLQIDPSQPHVPIATPHIHHTPQAVCQALDTLCDLALRRQDGFAWSRPQYDEARWVSPASPAVAEAKESSVVAQRGQGVGRRSGLPVVAEVKAATAGGEGSRVQTLRKVMHAPSTDGFSCRTSIQHDIPHPQRAKQALATQCPGKRARVEALRGELATLTSRTLEVQRAAGALEPLVALAAGATTGATKETGAPSVADTAARVARMEAGLQALREEVRLLDVRVGMAQRQLLFGWRHGGGGQGDDGEGSLFALRGSREGSGVDGGSEDEEEEDDDDDEEEE